jgi:hypothetical protein
MKVQVEVTFETECDSEEYALTDLKDAVASALEDAPLWATKSVVRVYTGKSVVLSSFVTQPKRVWQAPPDDGQPF